MKVSSKSFSKNWKQELKHSIQTIEGLIEFFGKDNIKASPYEYILKEDYKKIFEQIHRKFRFKVTRYYLNLANIHDPKCPILNQILPKKEEIDDQVFVSFDPLREEEFSPIPNLIHKYPDRVLWYVSHHCAVYCRFCTRKRKVSNPRSNYFKTNFETILNYIENHKEIKEVILSGGDPLSLSDQWLFRILKHLKNIPHLYSIRIHTRMLATLPQRFTKKFALLGRKFYPLTIVSHFNHPRELTQLVYQKVKLLRMNGFLILNQSVLLKDINDQYEILEELVLKLISFGIKPYYLHQCDDVFGVSHFYVPMQKGIDMIKSLRTKNPGISIPLFVLDTPYVEGKIPIVQEYVEPSLKP
ncbi:MAG: KamA family radical SAM protein [Leptospiraceae bacterium]|nr:KamA family radical SAM protein [Leptospiraceae bacterium]MDW7975505.1 KamA family radical SAM protein [Leptospiraceae bacterium]